MTEQEKSVIESLDRLKQTPCRSVPATEEQIRLAHHLYSMGCRTREVAAAAGIHIARLRELFRGQLVKGHRAGFPRRDVPTLEQAQEMASRWLSSRPAE